MGRAKPGKPRRERGNYSVLSVDGVPAPVRLPHGVTIDQLTPLDRSMMERSVRIIRSRPDAAKQIATFSPVGQ